MDCTGSPAFDMSGPDVLALVGDAVVITDGDGRILFFNRAAEEIFGYAAEEVIGGREEQLIPERFRSMHDEQVRAFAAGEGEGRRIMGHRREVLGLRKCGEEFPVEATVSRQTLGDRIAMTVVVRDISERRRLEQELEKQNRVLQANESWLRLALRGGRMGAWQVRLDDNELECDAAARRLWGLPDDGRLSVGRALERIHPEDLAALRGELAEAVAQPREFRSDVRVVGADGVLRWAACQGSILATSQGEPQVMVGVTFDVTEQHELEEMRRVVAAELNHRLKNQMALVASVVALSARSAGSVEGYQRALEARLNAMSEALALPADGPTALASLAEQLAAETAAYRDADGDNLSFDGPQVVLGSRTGPTLRLVLHELVTNAAKYGSLSAPGGRLQVSWQAEAEPHGWRLVLDWRELDGPPVSPPSRRGFGARLIDRSIRSALGGDLTLDYRPEGLRGRIVVPLRPGEDFLPGDADGPPTV